MLDSAALFVCGCTYAPPRQLNSAPVLAVWNKVYRQGSASSATGVSGLYPTYGDASAVSGVTHKRIDTALAGFILLSIFNLLLLAVLGTAPTRANYNQNNVASTRGTQMTTTTTAAYPTTTTAAYPTTTTAAYPTTAAAPAQGGVIGAGQTVVNFQS